MSVLFSFESAVRVFVLFVCTSTYLKRKFPSFFTKKEGWQAIFYKSCVIGDRLSPYVASVCFIVGIKKLISFFI
jgi:hypothetical protein